MIACSTLVLLRSGGLFDTEIKRVAGRTAVHKKEVAV
jgi:hypothetical protein